MKLASVTISNSTESIIGEALASVREWVDIAIVIDTGITDSTLTVARAIMGNRLVVRPGKSVDQVGVTETRNRGLEYARELGADWVVILDTDERILINGVDIRKTLEHASQNVLLVEDEHGTYRKERFIRLPTTGRYEGVAHECLIGAGESALLPRVRFAELEKTPEQLRTRAEFIVRALADTTDPRGLYYLGESLYRLEKYHAAIAALERGVASWDAPEESAWACMMAAQCWIALGHYRKAIECCALGTARHAGIAEVYLIAALACHLAGEYWQATYWARHAVSIGYFLGLGRLVNRQAFRSLDALFEKPFEVLCRSYEALGEEAMADEARELFSRAQASRHRYMEAKRNGTE